MKRRMISLILVLVLCLSLAVSVSAANPPVWDEANLLSNAEESYLNGKLQELSQTYGAEITIITVSSAEGSVSDYVEYLYDSLGLGYGDRYDGVLLLVCMNPREYRILSNGFASDAIEMDDIDAIGDAIVSDLSMGDYAAAFDEFADQCEYYLDGYINGFPFDVTQHLIIALVIGLVVGLIVALVLKGQLKSVHRQSRANVYMKPGSMQLTAHSDLYLYRNVTLTRKESSSRSGSSRSGGSRNVGGGSF